MLAKTLNGQFEIFVGIDQTGASLRGGVEARPLPVAVVEKVGDGAWLVTHDPSGRPLRLAAFAPEEVERVLRESRGAKSSLGRHVAILADCVFGLPAATWPAKHAGNRGLWELFAHAAAHEGGYGLKPAAAYFANILARAGEQPERYPVRECERLSGANSVFRTHPFQKNIQCGTYRIWRDLGRTRGQWLNFRYFTPEREARSNKPWVFEAYPSLIWRELLMQRTRNLSELGRALKANAPEVAIDEASLAHIERDADAADAAVLAVGGYLLQKKRLLFADAPRKDEGKEGWIVGLSRPNQSKVTSSGATSSR